MRVNIVDVNSPEITTNPTGAQIFSLPSNGPYNTGTKSGSVIGKRPKMVVKDVISIGLKRSLPPLTIASYLSMPLLRKRLM